MKVLRHSDPISTSTISVPRRKSSSQKERLKETIDRRIYSKVEKKYTDIKYSFNGGSGVYPFDDGIVFSITQVTPGVEDANRRVGREILVNSIEANYMIYRPNSNTFKREFMLRMVIYRDEANTPFGDQLQNTTPAYSLISPFAHNTKNLRKVFYDKKIMMIDTFSPYYCGNQCKVEKEFIDLRNLPDEDRKVHYVDGTAGASSGYGRILVMMYTNLPTANQTQAWNIWVHFRVNYIDI